MAMRVTHTYAVLEAPGPVFQFLRQALEEAGYRHALIEDHGQQLVVMNGIAVALESPPAPTGSGDPFDPRASPTMAAMTPAEVTLGNATRALFLELHEDIARSVQGMIGAVLREARTQRATPAALDLRTALGDPRVLAGERWIYARDFHDGGRRFSAWQFRAVGDDLEARFYNPDRETADGIAIGWRPWRPAPLGLLQLRQPVTIIEPTEAAP